MDTTNVITIEGIPSDLMFNDVFGLDQHSNGVQFNPKKNGITTFAHDFPFNANGYAAKITTNHSLDHTAISEIDDIMLDKTMIPELNTLTNFLRDSPPMTAPVLQSYQSNFKFVNDLLENGDIVNTGKTGRISSAPKESNNCLIRDIVNPNETVLQTNGCIPRLNDANDFPILQPKNSCVKQNSLRTMKEAKPMESLLLPLLTPEPSVQIQAAAAVTTKTTISASKPSKRTKLKSIKPKQTNGKAPAATATNPKKRKVVNATQVKEPSLTSATIPGNVSFLTFTPKINEINGYQNDNSTIFPTAITEFNNCNGNSETLVPSTQSNWTAFGVPSSFNIGTSELTHAPDTNFNSTNGVLQISQITQENLLNCFYQEQPSPIVTTAENDIKCVPNELIATSYEQIAIPDAGKSENEVHQMIVCDANMLAETSTGNWANDCHSIIRSQSITADPNAEPYEDEKAIVAVTEPNKVTFEGYGSFVLENNGKTIVYHDLLQDTQIHYQLIAPKPVKKKTIQTTTTAKEKVKKVIMKSDTKLPLNPRRRRGRPRKDEIKRPEDEPPRVTEEKLPSEDIEKVPCSRTRYGRLSRPPKHMSKFIEIKEHIAPQSIEPAASLSEVLINKTPDYHLHVIDEEKNNILPKTLPESIVVETPPQIDSMQSEIKKRRNIDRFTCGICKKVYLGKNKMFKHLQAFPDHKDSFQEYLSHIGKHSAKSAASNSMTVTSIPETASNPTAVPQQNSLYDEFLSRVQNEPKENKLNYFMTELSNFAEKIDQFAVNLLTARNGNTSIKYVNKHVARLLNLQEGNYQLNRDPFDNYTPDMNDDLNLSTSNNVNQLIYNIDKNTPQCIEQIPTAAEQIPEFISLSLDGISDSKMNLTDGISEDRLLMELVKESIEHLPDEALQDTDPAVNYDHINDNAVEAQVVMQNDTNPPMLDISLDLFQFNSN